MGDSKGANAGDQADSREGGDAATRKSGIAEKVRDTAASQLATQKNRATDGLGSVAAAVRQTTQQLRDQRHDVIARYAEQAADQIDRLNERIREKDIDELMSDAQRLARRQPALFIGGAFALGLIGARFFKSSARDRTYGDGSSRMGMGSRRGAYEGSASGGEYRGYASASGPTASSGPGPSTVHDYQSSPTLDEEIGAGGDSAAESTGRMGSVSAPGGRSRRGQTER